MQQHGTFAGGTAVVVDAGRGVGRAVAHDFALHGAHVVAIDANADDNEVTCKEIEAAGGSVLGLVVDITDEAGMADAAARCAGLPPVKVLANCHMASVWGKVEGSTIESWERVIRTNLIGPVIATQAFLPALKAAGGGAIVHLCSVDGFHGNPNTPSYSAAKGGLIAVTHVMADDFASYGIRVNGVARAAVDIVATAATPGAYQAQIEASTPMRRAARPSEIAAAFRFLASEEASYITGVIMPVDGGRIALTAGTRWDGPPPGK